MRSDGLIIICLLEAGFCIAQEAVQAGGQQAQEQQESLLAGAGITYTNGLYRGADSDVMGVPLIMMEKGQFFIKGRTAGVRLYQDERWAFDAIGQWRFDGYDDDDSDYLEGMDDREMTIDAGAAVTVFDGWGATTVSMVGDILSKHSGQELAIAYSKAFSFAKWTLTPAVGVRYFSSSLGDYYYGVQPDEAIAGRDAYDVSGTWNPFAGLQALYGINERWSVLASARYTMLDEDIDDSPIVDDGYDLLAMAGIMYKF